MAIAPVRPRPGPRTIDQFQAFQNDLDAVLQRELRSLGAGDARYVLGLLWLARALEVLGRGLLAVGGAMVWTWVPGVVLLTVAHLIETMELGHNLMHGQFNWMNDPRVSARGYRWTFACAPEDWREFHNLHHHHWANVPGRDRDYGTLRLWRAQPWGWAFVWQGLWSTIAALAFEWSVAIHNLQLERRRTDPEGARARIRRLWPRVRARMGLTARREYLWWPLVGAVLAMGWAAVHDRALVDAGLGGYTAVALGNLAAATVRNVWAYLVIAVGHFTTEAYTFVEQDLEGESRGQWYLRQALSAANFHSNRVLDVLSGNASHQIEHHLFPDLPSNRLARIAPEVRAILQRHGVPYHTGALSRQVGAVLWRITRHSFPGGWAHLTRLREGDDAANAR